MSQAPYDYNNDLSMQTLASPKSASHNSSRNGGEGGEKSVGDNKSQGSSQDCSSPIELSKELDKRIRDGVIEERENSLKDKLSINYALVTKKDKGYNNLRRGDFVQDILTTRELGEQWYATRQQLKQSPNFAK